MTLFAALRLPGEILFGKGQRAALGRIAARLGTRVLVCTDSRMSADPVFRAMIADLEAHGLAVRIDDEVQPDVPRDSARACAEKARSFAPDIVAGIGGGSCLDMAKCAALLLAHGGSPSDYYGEGKVPGPVLPVIAVPTTAGTGSEVTPVAVLSDPDRLLKVGISSPHLIPRSAICDPDLTMSCPASLTAIAGADALTHAIEAFMARTREPSAQLAQDHVFVGKSALTDHFAFLAIELLSRSLERACKDGSDEAARADVMMGALAAGCAFGTAGTAAAHALQYPVGAVTHTAHGLGVATLLPFVMTFNRSASLPELVRIAAAMGLSGDGQGPEKLAQRVIERIDTIFAAIGIPGSLRELGLAEDRCDWTAEQALGIERLIKNNPRSIDLGAMKQLVRAAYDGDRRAVG
ncbi:alcohol dehydrogenase [Aureimonas sp. Leaf454]|uniref:iron-containing alcohol dehydrogenase n=1 Tax=Aureimonas sp. Leaf454 TaxID=1736381 RepID=UPI0006F338A5|nr:iron-containing alcohol dehydrogenase [Aureimonas sp. Leaf454]KQT44624.1 alcohol dehydrogenase [Aureimonas sp. Leaf454]